MESDGLWAYLTDESGSAFRSFGQWLQNAAPWSERDCRYALSAVKELKDIPDDELRQIPRVNVETMKVLSTQVRQRPEVIKAAQTLPEKQFVEKIEKEYPDQHIEARKGIHVAAPKSQSDVIERAIRVAMVVEQIESRSDALEAIAKAYLDEHEGIEEYIA
jgi:hypothetical protein